MNEELKKYYNKLQLEATIKSLIYGFFIGSFVALIVTIIFYYTNVNGLWITIATWVVVSAASTLIFKFFVLKISLKEIATRLDLSLNLDERMITMVEYQESHSLIANKQRINTTEKLKTKNPQQLKFINLTKPIIALAVVCVFAIVMTAVTSIKVEAYNQQLQEEAILTPEDVIIQELIKELRAIVDEADVNTNLKVALHLRIDVLENNIQYDETTALKIARIEDARREILAIIEAALQEKTTIIEELITHDSTADLGNALDDGSQEVIDATIDQMVDAFVLLSPKQMEDYVVLLADDMQQSVDDADIEDEELEQELRDLIQMLKDLIPKIPGDLPSDLGDALEGILEGFSSALSDNESMLGEAMGDAIDEAIGELDGTSGETEQEDPEEKDPEEDKEGNTEGEEQDDGTGEGKDIQNPKIIDGNTEYSQEIYDTIRQEMIDMIGAGTITDDALITLINEYINSIELTESETETE